MTDPHPAQPGPLRSRATMVDGVYVVALSGNLDHNARERIEKVLMPPPGNAPQRTVADLSRVNFMDSSGINVLIAAYKAATATGGWVRVAGARPPVLRVMELVGLDTVIACYSTVDQALSQ
ncbi:anti-sigma factor antagonist [Streptomyces sp. NPDC055210]